MTIARQYVASAVMGSKIYVFGGCNAPVRFSTSWDACLTNTVESFDGHKWSTEPSMVYASSGNNAVTWNNRVYVFKSGTNADKSHKDRITEVFDGTTWTLNKPIASDNVGRRGFAVFRGRIHMAGGYTVDGTGKTTVTNEVKAWTGTEWSPVARTMVP